MAFLLIKFLLQMKVRKCATHNITLKFVLIISNIESKFVCYKITFAAKMLRYGKLNGKEIN